MSTPFKPPIEVHCFHCDRPAQEWCVTSNGIRHDGYHKARVHLARTGNEQEARDLAGAVNKANAQLSRMRRKAQRERA